MITKIKYGLVCLLCLVAFGANMTEASQGPRLAPIVFKKKTQTKRKKPKKTAGACLLSLEANLATRAFFNNPIHSPESDSSDEEQSFGFEHKKHPKNHSTIIKRYPIIAEWKVENGEIKEVYIEVTKSQLRSFLKISEKELALHLSTDSKQKVSETPGNLNWWEKNIIEKEY